MKLKFLVMAKTNPKYVFHMNVFLTVQKETNAAHTHFTAPVKLLFSKNLTSGMPEI